MRENTKTSMSTTYQGFLDSIKNKSLSPTAITIVLYSLSILQPGNIVCIDHYHILEMLGLRRTAYFVAMRALKDCGLLLKVTKDNYAVNLEAILNRRLLQTK